MQALTTILVDLFVLFIAARLAGAVAVRLGQPAVIGELLAGVLIGPHALGLIGRPGEGLLELFGGDRFAAEHALELSRETVAELGVVVLLFGVGLEMRATDLLRAGGRAALVTVLGMSLTFALGVALMLVTGHTGLQAAFVGTALSATSAGITARVLQERGVLGTREARIILGAAVIDDVVGLIVLAIVSSAAGKDTSVRDLLLVALQALAFVVFVAWAGTHATRRFSLHLSAIEHLVSPLSVALTLMLGLAAVAGLVGLAGIVGAFLAGMVLAEFSEQLELERTVAPIAEFLVPFFFVVTGTRVQLSELRSLDLVALAGAAIAVAVAGKLAGAYLGTWGLGWRSSLTVGVGMVPRGEVSLIVAGIGRNLDVITEQLFAVIVLAIIATALIVPPSLGALVHRSPAPDARRASGQAAGNA